ncbi:MAG: hypothetical protein HOP15_11980 [Planctomycetes bacterium]|nr:hypothetical protein [Planctomycetota bacterium]
MGKKLYIRALLARSGREAFSLIEVTILALLLLVAMGGLSGAVLSSLRLSRVTEESALADEAARALGARMQVTAFTSIFRQYDANPANDLVPGTGPGSAFDVRGLTARQGDADGRVGRIVFPAVDLIAPAQALREDVVDARLGMLAGRDLNLDGDAIDDVTIGYQLLPVRVIVEWTGAGGNRSYELDLVLTP